MTAEDLLNILEQRQLVSSGILASLRQQVSAAAKPIAPAGIIKLLVDKQQLTPGQAEQLLRSTAAPATPTTSKTPAAIGANKPAANKPATAPLSLEEEMGLAPSKSTISAAVAKPAAAQAIKPAPQSAALNSLEDELGLAPTTKIAPGAAVVRPVAPQKAKPVAQSLSSISLEDELGLAPSNTIAPGAAVVKPVAPQKAKLVAQPASTTSLEDELGLTSESAGPANPTAAQHAAANSKQNATVTHSAVAKSAAAKPTAAQSKTAATAKIAAASDLGLEDDLFSDSGSGAGLFDEGLLGAAADDASADPLGLPADDPLSSAAASVAAIPAAAPRAAHPKRWKKVLAIVFGALGMMLLAAGIAAAVLLRPTGDPEYLAAEQDYKAEAWAAAVGKYNDLLNNYPSHVHAGTARVHRGLAQLRAELGERPQWQRVLETAEKVLPQIAAEPEFSELHTELAIILADLADALARSADESDDPAEIEHRVAEGRRALALATDSRYVPPAVRSWQRLQDIDDRLAVLAHEADRPKELDKTVLGIRKAAAAPDPAAAFDLRDKLLERFPELAANDKLQVAIAELIAAERALVKPGGEKPKVAVREERSTPIKGWSSIVARLKLATSAEAGAPALITVDGALYAFDSASGKVLWRRFVGSGPAASAVLLESERAGRDALLVDERYHDLLRVDAASGKIKWRQTFDKPLTASPLVMGTAAYLTTQAAVAYRVDLKNGEVTKAITMPATPFGSPVASSDGKHVFQLTTRGELFTFVADGLTCAGVLYLGVEAGGLAFPAKTVGRYLVVVDDYGLHESSLRVVALDPQGLPAEVVSVVPIAGRVAAAPIVVGNHLIVVNDSGTVIALEITGNRDSPLKKTSEAEGGAPSARWFLVEAGTQFWVAGAGWRGFELQKGRLTPRGKPIAQDIYDAAPSVVDKSIVGAYRRPGKRGAVVFASSLSGPRLWEVELGNIPDGESKRADSSGAESNGAGSNSVGSGGSADPLASLRLARVDGQGRETPIDLKQPSGWQSLEPFVSGIRLANQKWLWWREPAAGGPVLFDPKRGPCGATLLAEPSAIPAALAAGIVMPVADGALMFIDPATGKSLATPFRPYVIGGAAARWTAPAVAAKGTEVVIADGHPTLYQVAVQKEPQSQLVKTAGAELDSPVVAGPVVAGGTVYLVTRDGMLRAYATGGLKPAGQWKLSSRFVTWIHAAGDIVLLASGDELIGCSASKKSLWKSPLDGRTPCGVPLVTKQGIVVAATNGRIARFDVETGKELAKVELDQPLVAGPALLPDGGGAALTVDGCRLEFVIP